MYLPGLPHCQKAYKVYDLKSYHTFGSCDVKFHEYVFPSAHVTPTHAHCALSKIPLIANAVDPIPPTNLSPPKPSLLPSSHSDSTTVPYTQPRRPQRDHQQLSLLYDFEPWTYKQASISIPWVNAMNQMLIAFENNDMDVGPLPKGKKMIGCHVCRLKRYNRLVYLVFILLPTTIVFSSNVSTDDCIDLSVYVDDFLVMVPTEELISQALSVATPLLQGMKLNSHTDAYFNGPKPYPRLVRLLLYFSFTCPDISHGIQQLNQFLQNSYEAHWNLVLHVVCYFKGSPTKDLLFPSYLVTYCVADWHSSVDSHRSLTRFCIFLHDTLVSWKTKKQCTVSRSSAEPEYHSMGLLFANLSGSLMSFVILGLFSYAHSFALR
ncbi:UNVERIFIED_CONTAM: Retrovirus-related Pol polyprotein from transposon RE2 [Sesamum indicum]